MTGAGDGESNPCPKLGKRLAIFQQHKIMLAGANLFAEFGNLNPESWREIMLCNTALFTKLVDLDRFVTVLKASLHIRMTVAYSSRNTV